MDDDIDPEIGSLIDQLRNNSIAIKAVQREPDLLKKEDIEMFVIQKAGALVEDSLEMIRTVKDYIISAPDPKGVESLAGLITATSSAIETLNKLIVTDKKTAAMFRLKEMDADLKRQLIEDQTNSKIKLTREEMLRQIAIAVQEKQATSIDITSAPVKES